MHVAFPKDTFDKLINYISTKPFNEVENLINELKATIRPVNVVEPEPLKEPPKEVGDGENVQINEAQSGQSQTTDEGGQQDQSQEPESANQG